MADHAAASPSSACTIWTGARDTHGRGQVFLEGKRMQVHRIVCEQVHGPPPTPKHEAAHLCHNGRGGCINGDHLRWMTRAENAAMRTDMRYGRKLVPDEVRKIRRLHRAGMPSKKVGALFGVSADTVRNIMNGKRWWWLDG